MHYHIQFSDGGVKSFMRDMLPELGRCQTCRFIIENIAELEAIEELGELPVEKVSTWHRIKKWVSESFEHLGFYTDKPFEWKYDYLPSPRLEEYTELFTVSVDVDHKRKRAIEACREYHQQFCLNAEDEDAIYRHEGYRPATRLEQQQYKEMVEYIQEHPFEPILDEYTVLCADLFRLEGKFALAQKKYSLVNCGEFDNVVELGKKFCKEQDKFLKVLDRQGRQ
jgi:hypothetical protein